MSFHVPSLSRVTDRRFPMWTDASDGNNGAFYFASPEPGWSLFMIASDGAGWEHVSVSARRSLMGESTRTPSWKEMAYVKAMFWDDEDAVMQLHPKRSEYVNCHPHVLHLWRPVGADIPLPPAILVGPLAGVPRA